MNAELIDGELHLQPRPAKRHARAGSRLDAILMGPFDRGLNGPGGWIILYEPEIHFGADVLVPDLAGWRRERLPETEDDEPYFAVSPDWACEILSPSTAAKDRVKKLNIFLREQVPFVWFVDPRAKTLEVLRLEEGRYVIAGTFEGEAAVRAEPFHALELDLASLWSW